MLNKIFLTFLTIATLKWSKAEYRPNESHIITFSLREKVFPMRTWTCWKIHFWPECNSLSAERFWLKIILHLHNLVLIYINATALLSQYRTMWHNYWWKILLNGCRHYILKALWNKPGHTNDVYTNVVFIRLHTGLVTEQVKQYLLLRLNHLFIHFFIYLFIHLLFISSVEKKPQWSSLSLFKGPNGH